MSVYLSYSVEALTVVYGIRLGLSFEAERAVLYLLDTPCKISSVTKKITCVKLYAGLVGVHPHCKLVTLKYRDETK